MGAAAAVAIAIATIATFHGSDRRTPARHLPHAVAPSAAQAGRPSRLASQSLSAQASRLPPSARPAFEVGKPVLLNHSGTVYRWASVVEPTAVRDEPRRGATAIARLSTETPEGTSNLVLVLGDVARRGGEIWVRVRLPILPNNKTGWISREALGGYGFVHTHLVVDRQLLRATLLYDGKAIFRAPVGVGKPASPTPRGEFYVREKLTSFRSPFYGPLAFGTSARSSVLTDWPGGGFVGIHGTNEPELLPGRVSHGCIRMRNADILRLGRLMPVGTPVTIR